MTEINPEKESSTQDAWKQVAETAKATAGSASSSIPDPSTPGTDLNEWIHTNYTKLEVALTGNKDELDMLTDEYKKYGSLTASDLPDCETLYNDATSSPKPPGPTPPGPKPPTPGSNIPLSSANDPSGLKLWNLINTKIVTLQKGPELTKLTALNNFLHGEKGFLTKVGQEDGTDYSSVLLKHYVNLANKIMKTPTTTVVKQPTVTSVDKIEYTVTQKYNSVSEELTKSLDSVKSKISMMQDELKQLSTDKKYMVNHGASKSAIDNLVTTYNHKIKTLTGTLGGLEKQQKTLQTSLDGIVKNLDNDFAKFQPGNKAGANKEAKTLIGNLTKFETSSAFTKFTKGADTLGNRANTTDTNLTNALKPFDKNRRAVTPGNMSYLDFTRLDSTFIDWTTTPPSVNDKFNAWADNYIKECKHYNIKSIDFPFSQLNALDELTGGNLGDLGGGGAKTTMLKQLCDKLHTNHIKTQVAFGGGNAGANSFTICNGPGETFKGQADKLVNFMQKFGMTNADFDIESAGLVTKGQTIGDAKEFFKELHQRLHFLDKTTSLTVEGGLTTGDNALGIMDLLSNKGIPDWEDQFDNINLMNYAYGSDVQTASARSPEWGLEAWAIFLTTGKAINVTKHKTIPNPPLGPNPSKADIEKFANAISRLHQGFTNDVDYNDPAKSNAPGNLLPKNIGQGMTNGAAAGSIFNENQTEIKQDWEKWGYGSACPCPNIGNAFVWPAEDKRENPDTQDTSGLYDFDSDPEFYNDFYNKINQTPTDSITGGSNEFGQ